MSERLTFARIDPPRHAAPLVTWALDTMRRWGPVRVLGSRGERRRLQRLLAYGVLWSLICTAIEVPNLPDGSVETAGVVPVLLQVLTDYLTLGLCLALALFWATTGRGGWWRLALGMLVAAATGSTLVAFFTSSLWLHVFPGSDLRSIVEMDRTPTLRLALLSYYFWLILVYGGLAAVLYALRRRMDQMTTALRGATLARERNEAAIAEARISAMVERIEPDFLLEAMRAAREHYRLDPARGESIVNGCVVFLRTAMPQIRSRHSNLAAELDLADAFLSLRGLIATDATTWRIERDDADDADAVPADAHVPLPPLVLLPVLERLLAAITAGVVAGPLVVRRSQVDGVACVDIEVDARAADAEPIEAAFLDVVDRRLQATGGARSRIVVDRSRPSRLAYRLYAPRADARATPLSAEPFPRSTPPGA